MEVLLFGIAREIVGETRLTISPEENVETVGDLKKQLKQRFPELQRLSSMVVAVDAEYANDEQLLSPGSEVALIPPVSGG